MISVSQAEHDYLMINNQRLSELAEPSWIPRDKHRRCQIASPYRALQGPGTDLYAVTEKSLLSIDLLGFNCLSVLPEDCALVILLPIMMLLI